MKQVSLKILENAPLSQGIYRLRLGGDVSAVTAPGQFVNLKLSGLWAAAWASHPCTALPNA